MGTTHMAGNPMLRLSRARAGVGQPVHRGSEEEQPESFLKVIARGGVASPARGREGRRKRLRRRFGLVFGRGISASHSGDVALLSRRIVDDARERLALSHLVPLPGSAFAERTLRAA